MGTETRLGFPFYSPFDNLPVKLNNPHKGTETVLYLD